MPAKIVTLCDAVVDFLNGESYSQAFTATRANVPVRTLEETNGLVVEVFPGDYVVEEETRTEWRYEYTVNIAVSQVITAADRLQAEDDLLELVEEIEESLKSEPMDGFSMFNLSATAAGAQHFNAERLLASGQFIAVLGITYIA